jgi:hypothetical protein
MDLPGLHELLKQHEHARVSGHNLAIVRGTDEIQRVLDLTGVGDLLVLVDDPDDLVPPPPTTLAERGPTVIATLHDGPLGGQSLEVDVIEGRPPKIINVPGDDAKTCRYCLEAWTQSGPSAIYTFLYRV